MKILSIQVGKPKTIEFNGKQITTGIFKDPVSSPVMLRTFNLDGDGQADLKVHGGRDKALYAYSSDAYLEWKKLRPQDEFPSGAIGENLTIDFLPEDQIYIGDTYEVGKAIVQVTQPRFPCYKLAAKFQDNEIRKQFMKINRSGVYYRVLQEGFVGVGDEMKLLNREKSTLSIAEVFRNKGK